MKRDVSEYTEEDYRRDLGEDAYRVLRQKGTERAFTGEYWNEKRPGVYACRACGQELFRSDDKFDSGTGWPSYLRPMSSDAVTTETDHGYGMVRTEVLCSNCGSHLGHVFDDGPKPTGKRYCINSVCLQLEPDES